MKKLFIVLLMLVACAFVCVACNNNVQEKETEPPAHTCSFGVWRIVKASSCTEDGERIRTCECGATETQIIEATGHRKVTDEAVAATCIKDGLTEGEHCMLCGEVFTMQQIIEAKHDWSKEYTSDKDTHWQICSICGDSSEIQRHTQDENGYCMECKLPIDPKIQEGAYTIGSREFENYYTIIGITVPEGVTSIGDYAFAGCENLISVTIPNSITRMGNYAFYNCDSLEFNEYQNALYLGNADNPYLVLVKAKDTSITSCKINSGTKIIYSYAFAGCEALESITIPDGIIDIGAGAFDGCDSLSYVEYDNALYLSSEGNPYFILARAKDTGISSCEINGATKFIYSQAFSNCTMLESFELPEGIIGIGECAFYRCRGIDSIDIPNSVTHVGNLAFYECAGIESVTFGHGLEYIGMDAFYGCGNIKNVYISDISRWCDVDLENQNANPLIYSGNLYVNGEIISELVIPSGITVIKENVFTGCTCITSVGIPDSVTSIGSDAFLGCTNIKSVYIDDVAKWCAVEFENSGANPLYYATGLYADGELVRSIVIPSGVSEIGQNAFCGFVGIISVTIPESVTNIGKDAFFRCANIKAVHVEDVAKWCAIKFENLGANPLYYATDLYVDGELVRSIVIPSGVSEIGQNAFCGFVGIISVTIPDSVTSIGENAFANCEKLIEVHNVSNLVITAGSGENGNVALYAKNVYTSENGESKLFIKDGFIFYFDGETEEYYLMGYAGSEVNLVLPNDINDQKYQIHKYAFYKCNSLESITISDGVTTIGDLAFSGCDGLTSVTLPANAIPHIPKTNLNTVVITSGESIDNEAFLGCNSLTGAKISNSVKSIGSSAFEDCNGLTSVVIGDGVTSIGDLAFSGCGNLESVEIPKSVTNIGDRAFYNCSSLTQIKVDAENEKYCSIDGNLYTKDKKTLILYAIGKTAECFVIPNEVKVISNDAFNNCDSLTNVEIGKGVTDIGEKAFYDCDGLISVKISDGVTDKDKADGVKTSIGSSAFEDCNSLTSVVIGDGVTSIGDNLFKNCGNLTSVKIGNGLTSIGKEMFSRCGSLTYIEIPDSVKQIGSSAFFECNNLIGIQIPDSVTSIGLTAFYKCTGLTSVNYAGSEEDWKKISIDLHNQYLTGATINYNCGSEEE